MPLTSLAGVGPARAQRLLRLGLASVKDLLVFAPQRLERVGNRKTAAEAAREIGEQVSVVGRLRSLRLFRRGRRRSVLSAELFIPPARCASSSSTSPGCSSA
jgi:RecG-like helicase